MEQVISAGSYMLTVFEEDPAAPVFYTVSEAADVRSLAALLTVPLPTIVCIEGVDWNRDLSPWPAPKVFANGGDFSGGGEAFLHTLLTEILPEAERGRSPRCRAMFGYSLAGLFSIWALTRTDAFSRAASVSGSLWYDGFTDYLLSHPLAGKPEKVYLSLGDREANARSPRMQRVRISTEQAKTVIEGQGVPCLFELNPGGHFQDIPERQRRAVAALLR